VQVQDLESQLLQAHDQHRTVSADTEQRMRDLEARVQQQAEDRVRQLEAAGTAKLEEMSAKMQEEVMSKRQEWEERESQARAAHEQVQANLAEKERMAEEFGKKVQQLENALTTVQKQLADTTLHHDQIRQQLDASLARNEQQQANLQEQEMQIETLRERAGALEMKCAGLEKEKACLEQQQLDYKATVATQAEQVERYLPLPAIWLLCSVDYSFCTCL
jgi:chromosome segregation ATPase